MSAINEKLAFAARLKLALRRSAKSVETPAELALQFNLRHQENITPQAAQKWLTGLSKPTADKIETLAKWLRVSAHWLNYGNPESKPVASEKPVADLDTPLSFSELSDEERALLSRFRTLTVARQTLVQDLVVEFALEQEAWPDFDATPPATKP